MLLADPADNIPVGAPYSGANAPIKSGRILKGRSRGRHFRERTPTSRVRSEMSQTSALPSTLTRTVARAGNRDSTPGSEAAFGSRFWRFAGLAVGRRADLLSAARGAHDAGESRVPSQVPAAPPAVTSTRSQSQKGSSRRATARALPLVVRSDSLTLGSQHARTAACRASSYACSAVSGDLRPRWWPVIGLCRTHHRPRSSA